MRTTTDRPISIPGAAASIVVLAVVAVAAWVADRLMQRRPRVVCHQCGAPVGGPAGVMLCANCTRAAT